MFDHQTISVYHSRSWAVHPPNRRREPLDRGLLPSLLGYMLRRTQSAVFGDFAATFAKAGEALTPGEFGLLVLVDRNAGLSQMALARALGIDRSTLVPDPRPAAGAAASWCATARRPTAAPMRWR